MGSAPGSNKVVANPPSAGRHTARKAKWATKVAGLISAFQLCNDIIDREGASIAVAVALVGTKRPAVPEGRGWHVAGADLPALVKVIQDMRSGRAIVLLPEDETFTTQAAANFLGMSRQHFVGLRESGKIPFHRVGSHRRVTLKDLPAYAAARDAERRERLGRLFRKVKDTGLYDADCKGDAR
jgi:excisionase family DNA binding protein